MWLVRIHSRCSHQRARNFVYSTFDDYCYRATPATNLYRYVDALCGTTGAGAAVNEIFLARMATAMQTIYFNDLDYIFGKVSFLARSPAESYSYRPHVDMLTSDQWDEIRVKDAWYRARIADFFQACGLGGTPDGLRMCVRAAVDADADIYEVWRYIDNFGLTADLGRSHIAGGGSEPPPQPDPNTGQLPANGRNEVVIRPHKDSLSEPENRLLRDMLAKICPLDVIVTVNVNGLAVSSPVPVATAAASSEYYQVEREVTATALLDQLLPDGASPDQLSILTVSPTENWLFKAIGVAVPAPYAAFNMTSEYAYYYTLAGDKQSTIDSITYGTMQQGGNDGMLTYRSEPNFQMFDTTGQYTPLTPWPKVDSPDNYPGGQFGIHPAEEPALHPDGSPYIFQWNSQAEYIESEGDRVLAQGGLVTIDGYQLPLSPPTTTARVFYPEYAIAFWPPSKDSTVSASLTMRRDTGAVTTEIRDPVNFVRPS